MCSSLHKYRVGAALYIVSKSSGDDTGGGGRGRGVIFPLAKTECRESLFVTGRWGLGLVPFVVPWPGCVTTSTAAKGRGVVPWAGRSGWPDLS